MQSKNTIEEIEQSYWGEPPVDATNLVLKCYALRKKDLAEFSIEDLRLLIGQNRALEILIPKAISILGKNIFAEGHLYEGDLLENVLSSEKSYWQQHSELKQELIMLFDKNIIELENLDTTTEIREAIKAAFAEFKNN